MSENLPAGWAEIMLGDAIQIQKGKKPTDLGPQSEARTVPYINIAAFETQNIAEYAPEQNMPRCEPTDTLLVWDGARAGLSGRGIAGYIGSTLARLVSDLVNPDYLFHFVQSIYRFLNTQTKGVGIPHINPLILTQLSLLLPPRTEQTRIVTKLEELLSDLDAGVAELKTAQKKLKQYRQSLLKAAVEGSLTAEWRKQRSPLPNPSPTGGEGLKAETDAACAPQNSPTTDQSNPAFAPLSPRGRGAGGEGNPETGAQLLQRILVERRARWEAKQLAKFQEQGKAPPKDWQKKYPEPVQPDTKDLPELPEGWVWASIDQLSPDDLTNGRSVPTAENGAKVLRLTAVRDGKIDLKASKGGAWTEDDARPFWVTEGDLLIVRGNGNLSLVGRAGLVPAVSDPVAYPDTLIRLRVLNTLVIPAWIGTMWDSALVRSHIELRARTSAGIYKISQPDIVSAVVPIPPILEQRAALEAMDTLRVETLAALGAVELALNQSAAQRQNILRAAFAGKLVPQDPNDEPASVLLARIRAERAERDSVKKSQGHRSRRRA